MAHYNSVDNDYTIVGLNYRSVELSSDESVKLKQIVKRIVEATPSDTNPKKYFEKIYRSVISTVEDMFKGRLNALKSTIEQMIKIYLRQIEPTPAIENRYPFEEASSSKKGVRSKYEIRNGNDEYLRLKILKETEERQLKEAEEMRLKDLERLNEAEEQSYHQALSLSLEQIEYEKQLNETIAKSFEEEKSKLLNLLIADDIDFNILANQLNQIQSAENVVAHKGKTIFDRSALILAIIEMFGNQIINTKHVQHHITAIRDYCMAIASNVTYQPNDHQKDYNSSFNIYAINDYLVNIHIKGDGNCLWSSVSHSLIGDYTLMKSLRLLTAASLMHYSEMFSEALNSQISKFNYNHALNLEQLINVSVSLQSWGDEFHIMALSLALKRPIYSYGSLANISYSSILSYDQFRQTYETESFPNHFKYIGDANDAGNEPILLHYDGNTHYSAVLKRLPSVNPFVPFIQIVDPIIKSPQNNEIRKTGKGNETEDDDNSSVAMDTLMNFESKGKYCPADGYVTQIEIASLNSMLMENDQLLQHYKRFFENVKEMVDTQTIDWKRLKDLVEVMENKR